MVALLVLFVGAGIVVPFAHLGPPRHDAGTSSHRSGDSRRPTDPPRPETVTSVVPAAGATGVAPDTTIALRFSQPLEAGAPEPSLSPPVAGAWQVVGTSEMLFSPAASFVPSVRYTVTVPGGTSGILAKSGMALDAPVTASFTVAPGSVLRLQQLLATLGYLPVGFSGPAAASADMALPQPGMFLWREHGFPASYTSL
jgi:hypothetical protein